MNTPDIITINVYRRAERFSQTVPANWLGLYYSGIKRMQVYRADGRMLCDDGPETPPHLFLRLPGMRCRFEFGRDRENFVIAFRLPELTRTPDGSGAQLDGVPIPFRVDLARAEAEAMRRRFQELVDSFRSQLPEAVLRAKLTAAGLLGAFLTAPRPTVSTPAGRLRELIDRDVHWEKTLTALSKEAGGSRDHLRRLFRETYHIDPGEYRRRKRLDRVMELILQSDFTLKEIAAEVGMAHVTHLYALLGTRFAETPAELIRHYRKTRQK